MKCRRLIESPWYRDRWGDRFALTSDQNTKGRFDNNRSGYRLATSVGGAATGEGGDRIVCDDPHNVQEAESDASAKTTLDWCDVVISTRVNDPKTAAKVVVMQRCHQQDLSGHLLEQGGWEHLCLPAEYEGPRPGDFNRLVRPAQGARRVALARAIWPARDRVAQSQPRQLRRGGSASAAALARRRGHSQTSLVPILAAARGAIFRQLSSGCPTAPSSRLIARSSRRIDEVIQSWDCAFKDLATSDYVVGQVWGRSGAAISATRPGPGRMDYPSTVKAVVDLRRSGRCASPS